VENAAPPRVLFLDDDPVRAEFFLDENPHAVWVQTVAECVARLAETWDEVHLDHDLGGEQFVEMERDDCGMEVVRWLCLEPRPHLTPARFLLHSHNAMAAAIMGLQLTAAGFHAELRPFGAAPMPVFPEDDPFNYASEPPPPGDSPIRRVALRLLALFRRAPLPAPSAGPIVAPPGEA
jgi:hypothetical protein